MMKDKIVIRTGNQSIKGITDRTLWRFDSSNGLTSLPIIVDGGAEEWFSNQEVKAVFFVKTFEGKSHDDLRFHDHFPHVECLWVRITFNDGEVMEGLINNHCEYVLKAGFFFFPIDPEGNNLLVYVQKSQIREFHVLGLRAAPRNLPDLSIHPAVPN